MVPAVLAPWLSGVVVVVVGVVALCASVSKRPRLSALISTAALVGTTGAGVGFKMGLRRMGADSGSARRSAVCRGHRGDGCQYWGGARGPFEA